MHVHVHAAIPLYLDTDANLSSVFGAFVSIQSRHRIEMFSTDSVANVIIAGFPNPPSPVERPAEIVIITVNFDLCLALPLLNPVASESTQVTGQHTTGVESRAGPRRMNASDKYRGKWTVSRQVVRHATKPLWVGDQLRHEPTQVGPDQSGKPRR